jgi:hypothetical protein
MQFSLAALTSAFLFAGAVTASPLVTKRQTNVSCAAGSPVCTQDTYNTIVRVFREKVGTDREYPNGITGSCCSGFCLIVTSGTSGFISAGTFENGVQALLNTCIIPGGNTGGGADITGMLFTALILLGLC